jgi:hypothetical protein
MSEQLDDIPPHILNDNKKLSFLVATINHELQRFDCGGDPDTETRGRLADKLDALWPYTELDCVFSGPCDVNQNGDATPSFSTWADGELGVSEGFWIHPFGRNKSKFWRVALGFYDTGGDFTENSYRYLLNTAAPQYGVTPLSEVDDAFPEGLNFPTLHSMLSQESDKLVTTLNDDEFFKLSADEQKYVIDTKIAAVMQAGESLGGVVGRAVAIGADAGFRVADSGAGLDYRRVYMVDSPINGKCEGVIVLPRMRLGFGEPIRTKSQLIDPSAGLCLAVCLDDDSAAAYKLEVQERLYIPISGQDIEVIFDEAVVQAM